MTRKDYIRIAAAVREAGYHKLRADAPDDGHAMRYGINAVASELAHALAADNARFDRSRFLAACGVEGDA